MRLIDETPHLQLKFLNIYGIPARQAGTFAHFLEIRSEGPILHFSEAAMAWLFLVGIDVADGDNISVAKFFNRILGLQFDRQNTLFQVLS